MKTLDEIFCEHGTDKGSKHTYGNGHNYAPAYQHVFEPLRFDPLKLVEIGVGGGESVRSWLEYFPSAKIFGVDITEKTNPWNTPGESPDPRYCFLQGNQDDPTMWACWLANCGAPNIVVDDGSHENTSIIITFNALWPALAAGGIYCIEDIGAGYTPGSVHVKPGQPDHKSWLHALVDRIMTGAAEIESVSFSHELAIIKKKA